MSPWTCDASQTHGHRDDVASDACAPPLDIDDDILQVLKERARSEGRTTGRVLSDIARRALSGDPSTSDVAPYDDILGFAPMAGREVVVTNEIVNEIRRAEGI